MVVPPDYEISRCATLQHISDIAKSLGLNDDEFNLYGKYQAKVSSIFRGVRGVRHAGSDHDYRDTRNAPGAGAWLPTDCYPRLIFAHG